jgi:hypothetical protein
MYLFSLFFEGLKVIIGGDDNENGDAYRKVVFLHSVEGKIVFIWL